MSHQSTDSIDWSGVPFWKSSKSDGTGNGNCVEVGMVARQRKTVVAVRDSKLPTVGDFPKLMLDANGWSGLLAGIKSGDIS
jgi:hypothetical protein